MINKDNIKKLRSIFKAYPEIRLAYVFGSMAANKAAKNSDVDIAILLKENYPRALDVFSLRTTLMGKISKIFKREADVVVINELSSLFFKFVIIKEGLNIYETNENDKIDFECRLLDEYFDFEPFLIAYNKNYVKNSL